MSRQSRDVGGSSALTGDVCDETERDEELHNSSVNGSNDPRHPHHLHPHPAQAALRPEVQLPHRHCITPS